MNNLTLEDTTLKEYHTPDTRLKAISSVNEDRALKLIYYWIKNGAIQYQEFENLMAEIVSKVIKNI